jgi:hypothetical protein
MWMVTESEAVEMYARFWATRHGSMAGNLARKTATALEQKGDRNGQVVWTAVADAIDRQQQEKRKTLRQ